MPQRTMTLIAPAKLNLYLDVGAVRDDGYHDVTTILHALELHDRVELAPSDGLSVTCSPDLGVNAAANIGYRAAAALGEAAGRSPDVAIRIEKRIPHGGGLGGGSSDAAAVIAGLARWWELEPAGDVAMDAAHEVGADVAFFLVGGAALLDGRGDELVRSLPARSTAVVLVNPRAVASTAEVYRAFDVLESVAAPGPRHVADALRQDDVRALAGALFNGLTDAARLVTPEIDVAIEWLAAQPGVLGAQVAGSGATVFGLCSDDASATSAADAASDMGWWAEATRLADVAAGPAEEDDER